MGQPAGYDKNSLSINPFWEQTTAEPPLERSKWASIVEMTVFTKDGIEVQNLLRGKPALKQLTEPVYEIEVSGDRESHEKNCDVCNQEKRRD